MNGQVPPAIDNPALSANATWTRRLRWLPMAISGIVEFFVIQPLVDSATLESLFGRPLPWLTGGIGNAGPLLLVIVVVVAIHRTEFQAAFHAMSTADRQPLRAARFWGAFVTAMSLLLFLTIYLSQAAPQPLPHVAIWLAGWGVLRIVTLGLALFAAVPLNGWSQLVVMARGPLAKSAMLGAAVWGLGRLTEQLWMPLRHGTFVAVHHLLTWLHSDATVIPRRSIVGVGDFSVHIARPCSGHEGLGLMLGLMVVFLVLFRKQLRFPAALSLLPISLVLVLAANVVRIVALVEVGAHWSPEIAMAGFHSKLGWVLFCGIALGLATWAHRSPWLGKSPQVEVDREGDPNLTVAYLAPLVVFVGVGMLGGMLEREFPATYPLATIAGLATWWRYRRMLPSLIEPCRPLAIAIGFVIGVLWVATYPISDPARNTSFSDWLGDMTPTVRGAWIAFRFIGSVVVVPLAEELGFRGYAYRRIISARFEQVSPSTFDWMALVVSSTLFALLHSHWLAAFGAGLAFAYVQIQTGRISNAIYAHAVSNAVVAAYVLATQDWSLW